MKKVIAIIICLALSTTMLVGCGRQKQYEFGQAATNIKSIEILSLSNYFKASNRTLVESEPVASVSTDHWLDFINSFHEIPCFTYFNDPAQMIVGDTIRITYQDGAREFICAYSGMYLSAEGEPSYPPYYFESEAFDSFIGSAKELYGAETIKQ